MLLCSVCSFPLFLSPFVFLSDSFLLQSSPESLHIAIILWLLSLISSSLDFIHSYIYTLPSSAYTPDYTAVSQLAGISTETAPCSDSNNFLLNPALFKCLLKQGDLPADIAQEVLPFILKKLQLRRYIGERMQLNEDETITIGLDIPLYCTSHSMSRYSTALA